MISGVWDSWWRNTSAQPEKRDKSHGFTLGIGHPNLPSVKYNCKIGHFEKARALPLT